MKKSTIALFSASLAAAFECFAAPTTVAVTSFTQTDDRTITIDYTLTGDPAVITLDIQTNALSWASIGGRDLCRAQGDVWKRVDAGSGRIIYRPGGDEAYPVFASGNVRAVLKAYPTNDPPAYMVVDLTQNSSTRVRFYPSEDFVPGGVLSNADYRISKLLMRKIPAAGVTWTMGSVSEGGGADETAHTVCLAENYYLACFEFTQAQAQLVSGQTPANLSNFTIEGSMRPCDRLSYYKIRENVYNQATDAENTNYQYPKVPCPTSFLGLLRTRSGNLVDFDLPSEAQWEYACRAGTGEGVWNTGKPISSAADLPGRFNDNGGKAGAKYEGGWKIAAVGPTNGIATVGSYAPNDWGLYDMHGNIFEWCLDLYTADITMLNGEVNVQPGTLADGKTAGKNRVRRGGYFLSSAADCRSARRSYTIPNAYNGSWTGFRPAAPAVAK